MKMTEIFKYILVAHGKASANIIAPNPKYMTRWPHGKYGGGMGWIYNDRAILLYQGTAGTWDDWKRNFDFIPCDSGLYCGVHRGFAEEYEMFRTETHRFIDMALLQNIKNIIFTGYSQGASSAALAAVDCSEKYSRCMTCTTFGSPQYLTEQARHRFNTSSVDFQNVVNPLDIVTKVVPGAYRPGADYALPVAWWKWLIPAKFIVGIADHTLESYQKSIEKD